MTSIHPFCGVLLAAALGACSPPAKIEAVEQSASVTQAPPAPPPETAPAPDLSSQLAQGAWVFEEGNVASSTGFGPPDSESLFFIECERGAKRVSLGREHELTPDQDTVLTITTQTGSYSFPARSFNEGLPTVTAELPAPDPRLAALAAATGPFAVVVGTDTLMLPAHESIARVLALCGVK